MPIRTRQNLLHLGALCLLALAAGGCAPRGSHSALEPAGPAAGQIHELWLVYFWVCTAVYALVILALFFAVVRHHPAPDTEDLPPRARRRVGRIIGAAVGATVLVLAWLMVATFATERRIAAIRSDQPLVIQVTGRQWWWDVNYHDADASRQVRTANELHIPVGRPVLLRLRSADVIHSFWVPSLHGKRDLIPGRENQLWIQADRAGEYEGQCAEFCGLQHAHMRLLVVAAPEEEFAAWLEQQRRPAAAPRTEAQHRGREVFLGTTCMMCHTVRGTTAGSRVGPDLTHLASRRTLAAGTLPNNRGNLAGWILDPQSAKPGNLMPAHAFASEDFHALLAYLESLE